MKGDHAHLRWAIAWAKPTRVSRPCSNEPNQLKYPKKINFAGEREPKSIEIPEKCQFCRCERTQIQLNTDVSQYNNDKCAKYSGHL